MIPVVTKVESRGVTRVILADGTAQDFLAWLRSRGQVASLRLMAEQPARNQDELERALDLVQEWQDEITNKEQK